MATSGKVDFKSTAEELIKGALEDIGYLGADQNIEQADFNTAMRRLNLVLKHWQTKDIGVYKQEDAVVIVSATSPNRATSSVQAETNISSGLSAGTVNILIDSSVGMEINDTICIVLDNNTLHVSTINGIISDNEVTISEAITHNTSIGNKVISYKYELAPPLDVREATYQMNGNTEIPLKKLSKSEYFQLSLKNTTGNPNSFYYDRQVGYSRLYLFPVPKKSGTLINLSVIREVEDINVLTDNIDIPKQGELALQTMLAVACGPAFGRTIEASALKPLADEYFEDFSTWAQETASLYLRPDGDNNNG